MAFQVNQDIVRVKIVDSKENRIKIRDWKIRYYNQLVDLLSSAYTDESASANYSIHLLALAEEMARFRCLFDSVLGDLSYQDLRAFLLYQNLGSLLGFAPDESLSHEEYRKLLLAILSVLLGGARPENIRRGVELFTTFEVQLTEVFQILNDLQDSARKSALNVYDSVLTVPHEQGGGPLTLNSEGLFQGDFLTGRRKFMFFVDIMVLDAINPQLPDKGGVITDMLNIVKPAHTEFLLRTLFLQEYQISQIMEEVFTKVELGIIASTSGSLLNDPTDLLTGPLGPGTNLFTLTTPAVIGFVPLTTFFV